MRWLLALTLLATVASADDNAGRFHRFCRDRSSRGFLCDSEPFFSAFPASGAGTTTACSTTAPTGATGQTLSMTRTGNATCSKQGPATTGILDGDLVILSDNQPRVSLVGSLLAYLRETARTNYLPRSEAIDNAVWTNSAVGAVAPTITANAALAPDGQLTADRIEVPALTAAKESVRYQVATTGANYIGSLFVRGVSGSGTLYFYSSGGNPCTACPYVSTSWTRCVAASVAATGSNFAVGASTAYAGCSVSSTAAVDAYVWGMQAEAGTFATGYIPTAGSATGRGAESALSATLATAIGPAFSLGVSFQMVSDSAGATTALQLGTAATDLARVGRNASTSAAFLINATSTTPAVSAMGVTLHRGSLNDTPGTRTAWWDSGSVSAPASSMVAGTTAISFGGLDMYTARACADPAPGRCDP